MKKKSNLLINKFEIYICGQGLYLVLKKTKKTFMILFIVK